MGLYHKRSKLLYLSPILVTIRNIYLLLKHSAISKISKRNSRILETSSTSDDTEYVPKDEPLRYLILCLTSMDEAVILKTQQNFEHYIIVNLKKLKTV